MSDACRFIHDLAGNFDRHKFPFEPKRIPESGIYLLFEAGETAHGTDRIVQVGTHSGKAAAQVKAPGTRQSQQGPEHIEEEYRPGPFARKQ